MAHRADGLNDIFEHNVIIREDVNADGGTVAHTPLQNNDILNKKFFDDNFIPSGLDGYVQFNDNGSFGSDIHFQWDDTNKHLGIGNIPGLVQLRLFKDTASTTPQLKIEQDGTGDAAMEFLLTGARAWSFGIDNSDNNNFKISKVSDGFSSTADLTIDATSGKVGMARAPNINSLSILGDGVGSKNRLVELQNEGAQCGMNFDSWSDDATFGGEIFGRSFRNTIADPRRTKSGDVLFKSGGGGAQAVDDATTATILGAFKAAWEINATEDWTSTGRGAMQCWKTTETGAAGMLTRMCLENDGAITFQNDGGLCFGEIYAYDEDDELTITTAGIANKIQITTFEANGESNNTTPDYTNSHITITKAGIYKCNVSIHAESAAAGGADTFGFAVYKNNGATLFENCHAHRQLSGGGGDIGSIGISGLLNLAVDDTIEIWCWNDTSTDNIVIDDINLNLILIGS